MVAKTTLPAISDKDIDSVLTEAFLNSARNTEEYKLGCMEERQRINRDALKQTFEDMYNPAEAFLSVIRTLHPDVRIKQMRIGFDQKMNIPAVLVVIDSEHDDKLSDIRHIARMIERMIWTNYHIEGHMWSLSDKCIEQKLVEQDFPLYRVNING